MANRIFIYNNLPKLALEHREQIISYIFVSSREAITPTNSGGIMINLMKMDTEEHAIIKDMITKRLFR